MKTSVKTVLTMAMTALVLSASVLNLSAAVNCRKLELSPSNPDIKKVIVTGNAKVYLVQSNQEWVTYDENFADKVTIKQVGNTLTVNSSDENPVSITVYVKDIYRIDASESAVVKTSGKFNLDHLQVMLKDNACARVKASTKSLYTVIKDKANLELLGSTDKHIAKHHGFSSLNMEKFAALSTEHAPLDEAIALNVTKKK